MNKIVTVIGARPQFIKAATVSRIFLQKNAIDECIVHTGQHYDINMSDIFFSELEIPKPKYNLGIGGSTHGAMTGQQIEAIEKVLIDEKPTAVLVYGDTNSTLAGAVAAAKLNIPIAHVEAGLRSFNRRMPEEINRVLTDHAADLLLAPTEIAVDNLNREGLSDKTKLVGDVMYDAALFYVKKAEQKSDIIEKHKLKNNEYILITIHRAENTEDEKRLAAIFKALQELSHENQIVFPIHPRTKNRLLQLGLLKSLNECVSLIDPVGYLDMVMLETQAKLIMTDSGGVQKEAFFHKVPCVTLRDETEWVELLESGWNKLVAQDDLPNLSNICNRAIQTEGKSIQPYGNGKAAEAVVQALEIIY